VGKQRAHRRAEHEKKLAAPAPVPAAANHVSSVPPPVEYKAAAPREHPKLIGEPQLFEGVVLGHKQFQYAFIQGETSQAFMVATKVPRAERYLIRKGTRMRCMVCAQEGREELFVVEVLEVIPKHAPTVAVAAE
jgi:hypothetical protein